MSSMPDSNNSNQNGIEVTVENATEPSDERKISLTDTQLEKLNQEQPMSVLTGDKVTVSSPDGQITGIAWSDGTYRQKDGSVPLTTKQQRRLGVEAGDTVRVEPGDGNSSVHGTGKFEEPTHTASTGSSYSPGSSSASQGSSSNQGESDVISEEEEVPHGVTYEDVGGLDDEVQQIREMVELPLTKPELFTEFDIDPPSGVLLHGPPGTGKTLIAKAIANETEARFFPINGPEIMSKYKGQSEKRLRNLFSKARDNGPAVIFFDEIDAIAGEREDESDAESRLVGQLLSLMDGIGAQENVIVVGATNRVNTLDPALRRGGRFDREIEIGVPDEKGRHEILEIHMGDMPLSDEVSIDDLASRTHGFVGADLATLTREAAMLAIRRVEMGDDEGAERVVTNDDFNEALASVEPSAMREFVAETPDITFDDVGGLSDAKDTLIRNVMWPLNYTDLFDATDTDPPSGVLLHGPSGTGKTLLGRALAGESEVNYIHVDSTELLDKYIGESEKAVRELFQRARQASPSVLFLDNISAIAGADDGLGGRHEATERVITQLNTEFDSLQETPNVTVLAAANNVEDVDNRLIRPNRLEEHIELSEPDSSERREILDVHIDGKPLADDVDVENLVEELEGTNGADIAAVVREASMRAIKRVANNEGVTEANETADEIEITKSDFRIAIDSVMNS